ncbi:MAG: 1-deoxy-D-xylulose-5-phosphate reductoisomerase [Lachnospiraceae bacterium]|nr:1-deoxy-D-xylulose-5-phosphate reductoisomerase [Lachnospiraceae bacterium]
MKRIAILGSTGSIGTQTLEVVRANGDIEVFAIAAASRIDALESQIREFSPRLCGVWDEEKAAELRLRTADTATRIVSGMEGLLEIASADGYEILVTAVVGMIGIRPTLAAVEAGRDIALANKETLVTAGHLIMPLVKERGVRLLPVDSEHSAIFQCLNGESGNKIEKILLTASGGPFRGRTRKEMERVTVEDALRHPNWAMGKKITIDSSTMVNKGLEVMEAHWLFDVAIDDVQVVIQPKSVIHSMVQFTDGAVMAQLGTPDMKLPSQYALYYPERRPMTGERLDFWSLGQIAFEKPDYENFKGLSLAREAGRQGGSLPVVFNAANERAVAKFLNREIPYLAICDIIEAAMGHHKSIPQPSLEEILAAEAETYAFIDSMTEIFS